MPHSLHRTVHDSEAHLTSLECWRDHFELVSNISSQFVPSTIKEALESTEDGVSPLEYDDSLSSVSANEEISKAIQSLKRGRAPGKAKITAELLGGKEVAHSLVHLAVLVWESESVPADWLKQLTVPLYKKGPSQNCDNYRGIALLSVTGKVF